MRDTYYIKIQLFIPSVTILYKFTNNLFLIQHRVLKNNILLKMSSDLFVFLIKRKIKKN
jgi:hypothetical protein